MSYCRFSSDDHMCDVYVYADAAGGWTTHVAASRVVYTEPLPAEVLLRDKADTQTYEAWIARYRRVAEMRRDAELANIGLPCDGQRFNDDTPGECADRLESLRALGYVVPQYAIDALRKEGTPS